MGSLKYIKIIPTLILTSLLFTISQYTYANSRFMDAAKVPALAYDATSIVLTWKKPDDYSNIVDYKVYQDGRFIGLSSENNEKNSPAYPYIKTFFEADTEGFHKKTTFLNYKVTQLKPSTKYKFEISAVYADGTESQKSSVLRTKTASEYTNIIDITDYGAIGDGSTLNTNAIQQAIDDCSANSENAYGCKVVIPGNCSQAGDNVFVSGALFLKSNMTLEIEQGATLKGSANSADYPLSQGYQLYSYTTNPTDSRRPPSLLNAFSEDHRNGSADEKIGYDYRRNVFQNIRVVGGGTIDGSGWVRSTNDTLDETGNHLAYFEPGSREKVYSLGVLAYNQILAAWSEKDKSWTSTDELIDLIENTHGGYDGQLNKDLYANRRSSLATFRGVTNFYFAGLNLINPAFHGVMFLEGENSVFAYNKLQTFDINNADGVEFGNSENSIIFNNFIDSGDDNVNFAAGQGVSYADGTEHVNPTSGVRIFNNYMREGHGAVTLGSHTGAWIQDMVAEENVMFLTDHGLRMKSTTATGGGARRIIFRDNSMKDIGTKNTHYIDGITIENRGNEGNPFIFTLKYSAGDNVFENAESSARFKDIIIQNVTLDNVSYATGKSVIQIEGYDGLDEDSPYPETYHEDLRFINVNIKNSTVVNIDHLKNSLFENVTFTNWDPAYDTVWQFNDSKRIKFINVTPAYNDL